MTSASQTSDPLLNTWLGADNGLSTLLKPNEVYIVSYLTREDAKYFIRKIPRLTDEQKKNALEMFANLRSEEELKFPVLKMTNKNHKKLSDDLSGIDDIMKDGVPRILAHVKRRSEYLSKFIDADNMPQKPAPSTPVPTSGIKITDNPSKVMDDSEIEVWLSAEGKTLIDAPNVPKDYAPTKDRVLFNRVNVTVPQLRAVTSELAIPSDFATDEEVVCSLARIYASYGIQMEDCDLAWAMYTAVAGGDVVAALKERDAALGVSGSGGEAYEKVLVDNLFVSGNKKPTKDIVKDISRPEISYEDRKKIYGKDGDKTKDESGSSDGNKKKSKGKGKGKAEGEAGGNGGDSNGDSNDADGDASEGDGTGDGDKPDGGDQEKDKDKDESGSGIYKKREFTVDKQIKDLMSLHEPLKVIVSSSPVVSHINSGDSKGILAFALDNTLDTNDIKDAIYAIVYSKLISFNVVPNDGIAQTDLTNSKKNTTPGLINDSMVSRHAGLAKSMVICAIHSYAEGSITGDIKWYESWAAVKGNALTYMRFKQIITAIVSGNRLADCCKMITVGELKAENNSLKYRLTRLSTPGLVARALEMLPVAELISHYSRAALEGYVKFHKAGLLAQVASGPLSIFCEGEMDAYQPDRIPNDAKISDLAPIESSPFHEPTIRKAAITLQTLNFDYGDWYQAKKAMKNQTSDDMKFRVLVAAVYNTEKESAAKEIGVSITKPSHKDFAKRMAELGISEVVKDLGLV